jgi:DUF1365 family protein
MLCLDVMQVESKKNSSGIFGFTWYHPLRFNEKDYLNSDLENTTKNNDISELKSEPLTLSERIKTKVQQLNGYKDISTIKMLVQVRCFGIYFSPANFYFCYDNSGHCTQMLAEVSNTPWNERHYYLIDLLDSNDEQVTKKVFQVSPFMDLDMSYFWQVIAPTNTDDKLLVKITNKSVDAISGRQERLFDACLMMNKKPFSKQSLFKIWCQLPVMTIKIVSGIYWQALKIFIKRIPFIGYQKTS